MKLKKGKGLDKKANKKNLNKKTKTQKDMAAISTDEFFNQDFDNMDLSDVEFDEELDEEVEKVQAKQQVKKPAKDKKKKAAKEVKKNNEDSDSGDSDLDPSQHKKSLMNLKDTDPEFFNYLKHHDKKLLDFNVDDDSDVASDGDDDDLKHIPDGDLEVGSDESDYEPEDGMKVVSVDGPTKVTLKLIKKWQEEIQTDKSAKTIRCVAEAFHAALESVGDAENQTTQYKVEGGAIFNSIVQLCVMLLPNAFKRFLKIGDQTRFEAHKAKRFPKVKGVLRSYLSDLIKLFTNISSSEIVETMLKHLHQMLPFTQSFSSLRKPLLRIVLKFWSTGEEETVRVVSFLCIIKIATSQPAVLNGLMKTMYIKYVENSKFVSPNTLPAINFMRRSLTELYLLNYDAAYYNAFLYIRQLAIHLRNALTLKKKEHFQAVYNWQYINSLWFWTELISTSRSNTVLRGLLYPLVQITIGVIQLIPTSQYYPLRFHCVKMLIHISRETNTFIPSLPVLVDILEHYDFNRKHKIVSMKPLSLMCLLRVSKSQATENGYKDGIIDNVYELMLESAAKDSHTIYFPDMYVPCVVKIKAFLKKCHVANYCRKMKQLLDKIEESRKFLDTERAKQTFDLGNMESIEAWEAKIKTAGTPIAKFYEQWQKVQETKKLKLVTQNDEVASDFKLPQIRRKKRAGGRRDSDEDSDLEIPVEEMNRRLKKQEDNKKKKNKQKKAKRPKTGGEEIGEDLRTGGTDIVQDMKMADWD